MVRGASLGLSFIETHTHSSLALAELNGTEQVGLSGWVNLFDPTFAFASQELRMV